MKQSSLLALTLIALCGAIEAAETKDGADEALSWTRGDKRLILRIGKRDLATYVYDDPAILRPYFTGLFAPNGMQVTRNHPPIEGKDLTDHPTMHPGLWLAFGELGGHDFWRNKAKVEHAEFIEPPTIQGKHAGFVVRNRYVGSKRVICEETCRITIRVEPAIHWIDWDSQFSSKSVYAFGDQEEMGLGLRMATPLSVRKGGRIVNSAGQVNEKQAWGQVADWCDYSGTVDGHKLGIMLMADPGNFRRPWFHVRDYGLMVANPFGRNAMSGGKEPKSRIALADEPALRLRFAVAIHAGAFDPGNAFRDWKSRSTPR